MKKEFNLAKVLLVVCISAKRINAIELFFKKCYNKNMCYPNKGFKMKSFFNSAFTLAEVLIVIGIIGIVAAITIPNLMQKNYEKHVLSQLQSTHAILVQAIKMAEEENGELETWITSKMTDNQKANALAEKLKPFLKIAVDCGVGVKKGVCVVNSSYKR
jgi:prepilin-type N-terminal cleavage/methylation domain-containing protein